VFWQSSGRPPLRDIYRELINLRKQNAALCNGEVNWLENSATNEVVSFLRQDAADKFLVLINLSSRRVSGSVEMSDEPGFVPVQISNRPNSVDTVLPDFELAGYGWQIYHFHPAPQK